MTFSKRLIIAALIASLAIAWTIPGIAPVRLITVANRPTKQRVSNRTAALPLSFEPSPSAGESPVKFVSRGKDFNLTLDPGEVVTATRQAVLKMRFPGASGAPRMVGADELPGRRSYFVGDDPGKWSADVPLYARVRYEGLFPGVDMDYYGNGDQPEYDFSVAPGADVKSIRLAFDGAEEIHVDDAGDLVLGTPIGEVRHRKPLAYQEVGGRKSEVRSRYVIGQHQEVCFEVGDYDRGAPLVIDPAIDYSTFIGGTNIDQGIAVAVDSAGNSYVTGNTISLDFPSANPVGEGKAGVFVAKIDPEGKRLIYSAIIGSLATGSSGFDIAVDSAGNAYVCGYASNGFPTTPGAYRREPRDRSEVFALKLNPAGNQLMYSTFVGDDNDFNLSTFIAVDAQGNAYVAGESGPDFPTTPGAFQTAGGDEVFVTKVNASGSGLIYSTLIGGSDTEKAFDIAVDESGYVYVTGVTRSPNFPVVRALQPTFGGFMDAFVTKLTPDGGGAVFSTYLGGSGGQFYGDMSFAIAVDRSHNVYVGGRTESRDFPTTPGAFQRSPAGLYNAFVTKLNAEGSALAYSTHFGGGGETVYALRVDDSGNCYMAGAAQGMLPVTADASQRVWGGSVDAFVAKLNPAGSALVYSSYLGGSEFDEALGMAVDEFGNAYVTGRTESDDFPTTRGSFQRSHSQDARGIRNHDAFLTKLILGPPKVLGASVSGKKLFVFGVNFDDGAAILLNGEKQKTANDEEAPARTLVGKKAGKKIERGVPVTLQVRNSDGTLSNEFTFTRQN